MARFVTAGKIIARAALELGLTKTLDIDPFSSTDGHLILLAGLLTAQGREHMQAEYVWPQLKREATITTGAAEHGAAGSGEHTLPADFDRLVPATFWDRTNQRPVKLLSALEWQALKASMTTGIGWLAARLEASYIRLYPIPPPAGWDLAYEYVSTNWVIPKDVAAGDYKAVDGGATEVVSKDDVVLFDESLMVAAIKLAFKEAKGYDTTTAKDAYDRA